jgi:hypothetical protein
VCHLTGLELLAILSFRVLLHPLRNYPGPFIAVFSDCYSFYFAAQKRLHLAIRRGHLKYGLSFAALAPRFALASSPVSYVPRVGGQVRAKETCVQLAQSVKW